MFLITLGLLLIFVGLLCLSLTYVIVSQNKTIRDQKTELSYQKIEIREVYQKDLRTIQVSYLLDEMDFRQDRRPKELIAKQAFETYRDELFRGIAQSGFIEVREISHKEDFNLMPGQTLVDLRLKISK